MNLCREKWRQWKYPIKMPLTCLVFQMVHQIDSLRERFQQKKLTLARKSVFLINKLAHSKNSHLCNNFSHSIFCNNTLLFFGNVSIFKSHFSFKIQHISRLNMNFTFHNIKNLYVSRKNWNRNRINLSISSKYDITKTHENR